MFIANVEPQKGYPDENNSAQRTVETLEEAEQFLLAFAKEKGVEIGGFVYIDEVREWYTQDDDYIYLFVISLED